MSISNNNSNILKKNDITNDKNDLNWSLYSYKKKPISQQPTYANKEILYNNIDILKNKSNAITTISNIKKLRDNLSKVFNKKAFIIIAGDCGESFKENYKEIINLKCAFLDYLSYILNEKLNKNVLIIGRLAGQYSKPRSNDYEFIDGIQYYSYKGDNINSIDIDKREPDPNRLLEGFNNAIKIKNLIKVWDDNKKQYSWLQEFKKNNLNLNNLFINTRYLLDIKDNIDSLTAEYYLDDKNNNISNIYTCHEGLLLDYESALTRIDKESNQYYCLSAELLWIGERTNNLYEAHIEFFKGISNPIGIKVSLRTNINQLITSINLINPFNEENKIILITRLGVLNNSEELLIKYVKELCNVIKKNGLNVIFVCDPMHGNTEVFKSKFKIRKIDNLIKEINLTNNILIDNGFELGGIHFESTPLNVTECLDSKFCLDVIEEKYTSLCDPRINVYQATNIIDNINIK